MKNTSKHIILVLILAAVLRLLFLSSFDIQDDEALNAVRAVGPYDYMESFTSLSPAQILPEEQWWQKLSFHDHPPLVFWFEHLSIKIFGENPWGVRIPSALAGVMSVYLIYLIGRKLIGERFGLLSALFLAVSNAHVWASRNGYLESIELCFMLLAIFALLKAFENQKWWLLVGVATGLAILSKYFAILLLPVLFFVTWQYKQEAFKQKWVYIGMLFGLIIISPVIIYNYQLFQATGHFDAALSSLLGMTPDAYESHGDRGILFSLGQLATIPLGFHWIEIVLSVFGFGMLFKNIRKNDNYSRARSVMGWFALSVLAVFLFVTPARKQFLVLAAPVFVWGSAYLVYWLWEKYSGARRQVVVTATALLVTMLGLITINTQWLTHPVGAKSVTYLGLRNDSYTYRYLESWLTEFYDSQHYRLSLFGTMPQIMAYQDTLFQKHESEWSQSGGERALLVYDISLDYSNIRWLFIRRKLYEARPIVNGVENFGTQIIPDLREGGPLDGVFDTYYFVYHAPTPRGDQLYFGELSEISSRLVFLLVQKEVEYEVVYDDHNNELFWVFKVVDINGLLE